MDTTFFERLITLLTYDPFEPLLFNSGFFIFFFLFVLIFSRFFYHNPRAKVFFITFFSFYFYYKSSGIFVYLLLISSLVDFYAGKYIYDCDNPIRKKSLLILSVLTNLGILGYFK
ncbi:MBOAT family protein, partial [Bacteroidota bacterium]